MKKVLILSYFYPPGNFAGSFRPASWAKHFHEFDLFPIVITRHWDDGQSGFSDISSASEIHVELSEHAEIHRLPYRGNMRDRLLRQGKNHFTLLRRLLSFAELLLQNFSNRVIPFSNLCRYAEKMLTEKQDIEIVLITAKPFVLFRFGYLLKKKFPRIQWIADYRDPWNTHEYYAGKSPWLLRMLEKRSEKKWVASASIATSCSDLWCKQISECTGIVSALVMNGFDERLLSLAGQTKRTASDLLIIGHIGSLYPMQDAETMISGIVNVLKHVNKNILVYFWGLSDNAEQACRIRQLTSGFDCHFMITPKLPQEELYRELARCDLFLLFGSKLLRGWYPVKIFEYLASGKPVLMCPGDDAAGTLIRETNTGQVCQTVKEVEHIILDHLREFQTTRGLSYHADRAKILEYSRKKQAKILAELIKQL